MPYRTIVTDPPWKYTKHNRRTTPGRGAPAEAYYATMTMPELEALDVASLAEDEAYLFCWVTNPVLTEQRTEFSVPTLIRRWGFEPKTILTWVKTGSPGMGFFFRGMTEHVIFATRGDAQIPANLREVNVFTAARGEHSAKPDCFMDMVERVCPGPYLEMFSRRARFGWDTWGLEALGGTGLPA